MSYGVIILAAGKSTRFGENKLITPINDTPLLLHIINQYIGINDISKIIVVTGAYADDLDDILRDQPVLPVFNSDYETGGMISSIEKGMSNIEGGNLDGIFIHPGDIPFVTKTTIKSMIQAHRRGSNIIVPRYKGRNGHPVLIPISYSSNLYQLKESTKGLKGFLKDNQESIHYIQTNNQGILLDIDDPRDLDELGDIYSQ